MHEWRLQTQVHVDPWGQAKASPAGLSPNSHSVPQPPHPTVPAHAHDAGGEPGQLCLSPTSLCSSGLSRRPWAPCPLGSRGRPSWAVQDSSICTSGTSCWPSCWLLAKRTAWWAPSMTRWGLEDKSTLFFADRLLSSVLWSKTEEIWTVNWSFWNTKVLDCLGQFSLLLLRGF